jgi:predicted esterase
VPGGEAPEQGWPVMLYLHGAGGRGTDGQRQLGDGPAPLLSKGLIDWPVLVVFPQCEDVDSPIFECWEADSPDAQRALRILAEVERDYATDSSRRVLAGWSMGGYGAWSVAAATADHWAAVMPIAGGGDPTTAPRLTHTPIWAIHGRLDQAILPERSREMTRAVRRAGGAATLTLLPNVHHSSWPFALASHSILEWFLDPHSTPDVEHFLKDVQSMIESDRFAELEAPFRPELVIPRAVSVRLGERALEAISFGIPQQVAPHPLSSELDDLHVSISTPKADYDVNLTGLNYLATLKRCEIETRDQGRTRIRLGISPLDIVIRQTRISGPDLVVTADETLVRVGHRRPVWAEIEVRPGVEDHKLHLKLDDVDFEIPDDNWYVRAPFEIQVSGEGISRDMARIGIVGGLYQRRDVFESCIRSTLPNVVSKIESSLAPGDMEQLAAAIWPLPVYQPRLRLRLDDLSVDKRGISVMLGLEADPAVGLPSSRGPQTLAALGPRATEIHHSDWLEFGIAPGILAPLAQMLIDAGAARIDLSDLPHPQLAELGGRDRLSEFVPALRDLPESVEVKAELFMVQPFDLSPDAPLTVADGCPVVEPPQPESTPEPSSATISAAFHATDLMIRVSTRRPGLDSEWEPLAEFDLTLEQSMLGKLVRHAGDEPRTIDIRWNGPPRLTVSGRYLGSTAGAAEGEDSPAPVNADRLADLFSTGWQAWTASVANTHIDAPDLTVGGTPLRIERLETSQNPAVASDAGLGTYVEAASVWWLATYSSPATRLSNFGRETLTYQVRGPFSIWGARRELPAGAQDTYRVPYRLDVRVVEPFRSRIMSVNAAQDFEFPTGL